MLYVVTSNINSEEFCQRLLKAAKVPTGMEYRHVIGEDSYLKENSYRAPVIKITGSMQDGWGIRLGFYIRLASIDAALINEKGDSYRMKCYLKFQQIKKGEEDLLGDKFNAIYSQRAWEYMEKTLSANSDFPIICDKETTGMRPEWDLSQVDWSDAKSRPVEFGLCFHPTKPSGYVIKVGDKKVSQAGNSYIENGGLVIQGMEVRPTSEMVTGKYISLDRSEAAQIASDLGYDEE